MGKQIWPYRETFGKPPRTNSIMLEILQELGNDELDDDFFEGITAR